RLHLPPARVMVFHFHLRPATAMASRFHLPPGSVILQLVVLLGIVKAGLTAGFPCPAMETVSRWVVAAVSFVARSWPVPGCFAIADLVIAAADLSSLAGSDLAAAGGSVVAAGLSVAVDSVATVFAAAASGFVVGSVCSFAAATGKGRVVV